MKRLTPQQETLLRQASAERFPHPVPPGQPARRANLSDPRVSNVDLWQFYAVPEIRAIADRISSGVERVSFMPCVNIEGAPGDECPPIIGQDGEIADGISPSLAADCSEIWGQVASPSGPQSEIFGSIATALTVAGDAWQFGYPGTQEMRWDPESEPLWVGVARQSITEREGWYQVAVGIDGEVKVPSSPEVDGHGTAIRIWYQDPRYPAMASSWMNACIRPLQILLALWEATAACGLSRMNGGLIIAPTDQDTLPVPSSQVVDQSQHPLSDNLVQALYDELGEHVEESFQVADGWSRAVPAVVGVDSSIADKVSWVELARAMDPGLGEAIDRLRHRIYSVCPLPPEVANGMADLGGLGGGNVAAQIDLSEYQRAIMPPCGKIAWANTRYVLREGLKERGHGQTEIDRVRIGFSAKNLLMPPDRSDSAIKVAALPNPVPLLSDDELRSATGLGEFSGPDPAEARTHAIFALAQSNIGYGYLLEEIGLPAPQAEILPPDEVVDVDSTETRALPVVRQASARDTDTGVRLVDVATRYEERLATLADSVVAQMAKRSSAKVANLARSKSWAHVRDLIRTDSPMLGAVPAVREQLRAEDVDDGDLFEPALAAFADQFQTITTRAQKAGVREQGGDWDDVEDDADRANVSAWALFGALLVRVAAARFEGNLPDEQTGEGTLSPFGVPSDVITRVSAVAGGQADAVAGAENGKVSPQPFTTVTTGPISERVAASQGKVIAGYQWLYRPEIPRNSYLPHLDLDLSSSDNEDDFDGYYVGDHAGCLCATAPIYIDVAV